MRLWLSAVDDHKEHAWMALYENDRDVIEDLLYHRLKKLWSDCTDALAIFSKPRVGTELCGQKVWEALLSAFPRSSAETIVRPMPTRVNSHWNWSPRMSRRR